MNEKSIYSIKFQTWGVCYIALRSSFVIKMGFIYRNYNIVMISILATIFNGTEQVFWYVFVQTCELTNSKFGLYNRLTIDR